MSGVTPVRIVGSCEDFCLGLAVCSSCTDVCLRWNDSSREFRALITYKQIAQCLSSFHYGYFARMYFAVFSKPESPKDSNHKHVSSVYFIAYSHCSIHIVLKVEYLTALLVFDTWCTCTYFSLNETSCPGIGRLSIFFFMGQDDI